MLTSRPSIVASRTPAPVGDVGGEGEQQAEYEGVAVGHPKEDQAHASGDPEQEHDDGPEPGRGGRTNRGVARRYQILPRSRPELPEQRDGDDYPCTPRDYPCAYEPHLQESAPTGAQAGALKCSAVGVRQNADQHPGDGLRGDENDRGDLHCDPSVSVVVQDVLKSPLASCKPGAPARSFTGVPGATPLWISLPGRCLSGRRRSAAGSASPIAAITTKRTALNEEL